MWLTEKENVHARTHTGNDWVWEKKNVLNDWRKHSKLRTDSHKTKLLVLASSWSSRARPLAYTLTHTHLSFSRAVGRLLAALWKLQHGNHSAVKVIYPSVFARIHRHGKIRQEKVSKPNKEQNRIEERKRKKGQRNGWQRSVVVLLGLYFGFCCSCNVPFLHTGIRIRYISFLSRRRRRRTS